MFYTGVTDDLYFDIVILLLTLKSDMQASQILHIISAIKQIMGWKFFSPWAKPFDNKIIAILVWNLMELIG